MLLLRVGSGRTSGRTSITSVRAANTLIGIRRLLSHDAATTSASTMVRGSRGTAAGAKEPEESAGERERGRNPCRDVNVFTH